MLMYQAPIFYAQNIGAIYILNRKISPIWKSLIAIKLSQVQISLSIFG